MSDPGTGDREDDHDESPPESSDVDEQEPSSPEADQHGEGPDRGRGRVSKDEHWQDKRADQPEPQPRERQYENVSRSQRPDQSQPTDSRQPSPQDTPPQRPPSDTPPQRPPSQSGPPSHPPTGPQRPPSAPPQHATRPPPQQGYGLPPPPHDNPEQRYRTDPVKETYSGRVDLYDIATWEERSRLDSLAITVTNGLRASKVITLIAVASVLFFGQILVAGVLIFEEPLLAVLAVLSVLPALALAGYFWYGDPTMREPPTLLAATFLLSMLFASFAAVINSTFIPGFEAFGIIGLAVFFFVIVGPIEEFVKWLAIRVYAYQSDTFQTVADGAVYGAVAGLGFAAIENLIYIVSVYLEMAPAGGDVQNQFATSVATQRAFVGPGHVIFSAWAGFYLGLAKFNPANRGPIVVKGLLIAALIHALYNTMVTALPELLPLTVGGLFGIIILYHGFWFGLLYRKISKYRALYQDIGRQRQQQW